MKQAAAGPGANAGIGRSLDALNFFLADVRDGLGPYLAIYLLSVQKWDAASIGVAMSIGGIAGILAQTPAGALMDRTTAKRAVLVAAAVVVTLGSLLLPIFPQFLPVVAAPRQATDSSRLRASPTLQSRRPSAPRMATPFAVATPRSMFPVTVSSPILL